MTGFRESKRSTRTGRKGPVGTAWLTLQVAWLTSPAMWGPAGSLSAMTPCSATNTISRSVHAHSPPYRSAAFLLYPLLGLGGSGWGRTSETELQRPLSSCPWTPPGARTREEKAHCNVGFTPNCTKDNC